MLANVIMPMVMLLTPPEPAATREVDVTIRLVEAEGGKPIGGLALAGWTLAGRWRLNADAEGLARGRLRVLATEQMIFVQPMPLTLSKESDKASPRSARAGETYAMPARVEIPVRGTDQGWSAEGVIRLEAGCTLAGRVVDQDGRPVSGLVEIEGWFGVPVRLVDGSFEVKMSPTAREIVLAFAERSGRVWWHRITTSERPKQHLGEIRAPATPSKSGTISPLLQRAVEGDPRAYPTGPSVPRLISADGSVAIGFWPSSHAMTSAREKHFIAKEVPIGTYIALSGSAQVFHRVRDAILAGEDVVKKWGLQRVEVREGERLDLVIDDEAVYKAVMGELPPTINWTGEALVSPTPTPTPAPAPAPTPTKAPVPPEAKERDTRK
jgi:hypothetical protein